RVPRAVALPSPVESGLPRGFARKYADVFNALSPSFGSVRQIALPQGPDSGRVVIHVQDVHRNEQAQGNIDRVVRVLVERDQAKLLALEGAFGPIDLSGFQRFSHRDLLHRVLDYLLHVHEISGAIHAALTGAKTIPSIVGVDDPAHYAANVDAYLQSAP